MANDVLNESDHHRHVDREGVSAVQIAVADIVAGTRKAPLAGLLAWQDVKQRYRRSTLGPFWLTISMGVMIGGLGLVFGQIFRVSMLEFLPFLCTGLILWGFVSSMLHEGSLSFIAAEAVIKDLPIPLFVHVLRVYCRCTIILVHNLIIFPLILLAVGKPLYLTSLISLLGFGLVSLNLIWMVLLLAVLCTRYRDLPQIISSLIQIAFYVTPIIWMPELLPERTNDYLVDLNPIHHLLNVMRAPLLGEMPSMLNWVVCVGLAIVGWTVTIPFYGRFKRRVPYWL